MFRKFVLAVLAAACLACPALAEEQKSISIFIAYTGIKPIIETFERDTGIKVNYLQMSSG